LKGTLLRRSLRAASLLGVLGATVVGVAHPAAADIAPPGVNQITAVGSDTTEAYMESYLAGKTTSVEGATTYVVSTHNIAAKSTGTEVVPGDVECPNGQITWGPTDNVATGAGSQYTSNSLTTYPTPNGSSAGRRFLVDERATGPNAACVDIARSSSGPPLAGETSSVQYYAFAMDAVTWATQSMYAPATLTSAQIIGIYNCSFTNWNQVGGSDMPIQRLLPQNGSGTRSFFLSAYGISAGDLATTSATCPAVVDTGGIQENDGSTIPVDYNDTGIIAYSAGVWSRQANAGGNPTIDKRDGVRLGGYSTGLGVKALAAEFLPGDNAWQLDTISDPGRPGVVHESNIAQSGLGFNATNDFRGIRYLYNVIDTANPGYLPSRGLIGFNNVASGNKSPLCNTAGANLGDFGFARLDTSNPSGSNLAASRCRKFNGTG
jgi:phosphate transport system substrate-binding protein